MSICGLPPTPRPQEKTRCCGGSVGPLSGGGDTSDSFQGPGYSHLFPDVLVSVPWALPQVSPLGIFYFFKASFGPQTYPWNYLEARGVE